MEAEQVLAAILSASWANIKEEKQRSKEKEGNDWGKLLRPNNPRIAIFEAEQKFGGYFFLSAGQIKKEEKQRSREKDGNDWGKLMRPNNPRIAILEPEQKFGGYSFCQLGTHKGREAKKQRRGRQ